MNAVMSLFALRFIAVAVVVADVSGIYNPAYRETVLD
jgi:hypothetical protein